MKKIVLFATAMAALSTAVPAAAQSFNSTFEGVVGGPTAGNYTIVPAASGFTSVTNGIELQNNVAGSPAATGGTTFVELDTTANNSMFRLLNPGVYNLSFLYSARPGVAASSNGIEVLIGSTLLGSFADDGTSLSNTAFRTINIAPFAVNLGDQLTFRAVGTSDGVGGYLDNIVGTQLSAVPEPAAWGLMIAGFGVVGTSLRRRAKTRTALA